MPDLEHYKGREQGFVKHALIEKYLERFAIVISKNWDEIIYIDAFAGPWKHQSEDYSDTSFHVALKCLKTGKSVAEERFHRNVRIRAFLIEKKDEAFSHLSKFGESQRQPGFEVTCIHGEFEEKSREIVADMRKRDCRRSFLFALIDPKGWTGLSMEVIAPLVKRRSAEVLVNVMTSFIHRFVDVENCSESYDRFFGREGVREIIRKTSQGDQQDAVVREYCRSLRQFCEFKFVSSCVILKRDKQGVHYFMVFATNDPMGIKVFKEAEAHAAKIQDDLKDLQLHGSPELPGLDLEPRASVTLREKYRTIAFQRVEEHLKTHPDSSYAEVFCKGMAMPLVTEKELVAFLNQQENVTLRLPGSNRRKPNIKKEGDRVLWENDHRA